MHPRVQQIVKANWVLTGDGSPQSPFGIQNPRFECVHAGIATPLGHFGVQQGIKSVKLSNRFGAFVLPSASTCC